MSNEQTPPDDDQDVEPTVAEYHRADASKFPTDPAGQQAAVEGMAAAHGHTFRRGVPTDTAAGALFTDMMNLFNKYERETAADRARRGDTNPYDLAPYQDVHDLTNQYDAARASTNPRDLDQFLDALADDFHLDDVRALRVANAAVQAAMGRIALAARERGMNPDRIAAETSYTASRITQFVREEKQRRAAGEQ